MPWRHMGQWRYSSTILDLDTRWRWVVSFKPRPLYSRGNRPRYQVDSRLGGPERSVDVVEKRKAFPCWESKQLKNYPNKFVKFWSLISTSSSIKFSMLKRSKWNLKIGVGGWLQEAVMSETRLAGHMGWALQIGYSTPLPRLRTDGKRRFVRNSHCMPHNILTCSR
jgi:hypothetical protein